MATLFEYDTLKASHIQGQWQAQPVVLEILTASATNTGFRFRRPVLVFLSDSMQI